VPLEKENSCIIIDPTRLRQILSNLIDNALKFTNFGYIEVGYQLLPNSVMQFYVKDTGIGIPENKQYLIFERFRQVEETLARKHGGAGLGLAIAKGIVTLLGGNIWFESIPEMQTVFSFSIPVTHCKQSDNLLIEANPFQQMAKKNAMVLLVGISGEKYVQLRNLSKINPATIVPSESGFKAIEMCITLSTINLLIIDNKPNDMETEELITAIRQVRSTLPIVIVCKTTTLALKNKWYQNGSSDVVKNTLTETVLTEIIEKYT